MASSLYPTVHSEIPALEANIKFLDQETEQKQSILKLKVLIKKDFLENLKGLLQTRDNSH